MPEDGDGGHAAEEDKEDGQRGRSIRIGVPHNAEVGDGHGGDRMRSAFVSRSRVRPNRSLDEAPYRQQGTAPLRNHSDNAGSKKEKLTAPGGWTWGVPERSISFSLVSQVCWTLPDAHFRLHQEPYQKILLH